MLSGSRAVLESARAQLSLGRSPGSMTARRCRCCRSALDTARGCGARAVVRDAVTALAQRGQSPVEPGDAPTRLTSRQHRVTELVAAGLDVNEVAQRLFLTPRDGARRPRVDRGERIVTGLKSSSSRRCHDRTPDREECHAS